MPLWQAKMDAAYFDGTPADEHEDCEVRIDGSVIIVSYDDDGGTPITYAGEEHGDGHFELRCQAENGHATLHRFPESKVLEGYWTEQGARGFWRIHLVKLQN